MPTARGKDNMTKSQRPNTLGVCSGASKRDEQAIREAYRKGRKIESYLADDENFPSFSIQLQKMGLELRDIPGDGNCLFRALGDQLEGHGRNHFKHRQDVATYMLEHRKDFEPFIEDDVSFDAHIFNLKKLGTYAGNDAIVAFARLHQVNVYIHQLNAKPLMIQGSQNPMAPQLHISYHNGDHYSSVRNLGDNTESPANIRLQQESKEKGGEERKKGAKAVTIEEGVVRAVRDPDVIQEEVMRQTQCQDPNLVRQSLVECDYDVEMAVPYIMQLMEAMGLGDTPTPAAPQTQTGTQNGLWAENGTGTRIFGSTGGGTSKHRVHFRGDSIGSSSGYGSLNSSNGGARPKLGLTQVLHPEPLPVSHQQTMSPRGKKAKELKKAEKKKRAEERHKQKVLGTHTENPVDTHSVASNGMGNYTVVRCSSITRI